MDLTLCWNFYQKAEKLIHQGHWPEAYYLFEQVLAYLPQHVHDAATDQHMKPCQLACLIEGLTQCSLYQADILNNMGQQHQSYRLLNQSYALIQFLSLETSPIIASIANTLDQCSQSLLEQLQAFCHQQRSAEWQLEYVNIEKAHRYFTQLKRHPGQSIMTSLLN